MRMLELYHKLFKYSVKNNDTSMLSVVDPYNVRALYGLQKEAYLAGGGQTIVQKAPIVFARFHGELDTSRMITIPDNVVLIMPYCCGLLHYERTDALYFASIDEPTLRQGIQRNGHIQLIGKTFLKLTPGMKVCDIKVSLVVEQNPMHIPTIGMYTMQDYQQHIHMLYNVANNLFYDDLDMLLYNEKENVVRLYKNHKDHIHAYVRYLIHQAINQEHRSDSSPQPKPVMFKQSYGHIISLLFHKHHQHIKNMYNERVAQVAGKYDINISRATWFIEEDIVNHKDAVHIVQEIDYVGLASRFLQDKLNTVDLDETPITPDLMDMLQPLNNRPDNDPIKGYLKALSFITTTTLVFSEGMNAYKPLVYDRHTNKVTKVEHFNLVSFLQAAHRFDVPNKWMSLASIIHEVTSLSSLYTLEKQFRMRHYQKKDVYLSDIIRYLSEHKDYKDGVVLFNNSCQGLSSNQVCMSKKCIDLARNKGTEQTVTTFEQSDMGKMCECLAYMNSKKPLVLEPTQNGDFDRVFACDLARRVFYHHVKKTNPKILNYMQTTDYQMTIQMFPDPFLRYVNVVLNDYIYQAYRASMDPKIVEYMGEPVTV